MPPKRGGEGEDGDILGGLRPNASVSIIKAAKASLKQPSRPFTPAEGSSRQLFASDYSQARPPSSYGPPSSKHFYESAPRLPFAKPDPFSAQRADSFGRSKLDSPKGGASSPSAGALEPPPSDSPSSRLARGSPRPTAAETVAALKVSMVQLDMAKLRTSKLPTQQEASSPMQRASVEGEEDDGGPLLDPHRNDDLPARPSTSRGRPSSALGNEDPLAAGSSSGPVPAPTRVGPNAQVFGVGTANNDDDDDDDSPDDEAYRHMYTYAVPRPADELQQGQQQQQKQGQQPPPALAPSGSFGTGAGVAPSPVVVRAVQRSGSGQSTSSPIAAAAAARLADMLDPTDPIAPWRAAVEESLGSLAASTSAFATATGPAQRDAMSDLLRHATALGAHVEYMRRQPNSSRWLNAPCINFRDMATGQPLTVREAVSEHVFRLMDSTNAELLLKGAGIILRVVKSRQPLLQATKLLYRLSKDTANDSLYRRERLLEPILRTVQAMTTSGRNPDGSSSSGGAAPSSSASASSSAPSTSTSMHEPLVYLIGCLKNISNDSANQRSLVKAGALQVLSTLLNQMASQVDAGPPHASSRASGGGVEGFTTASTSEMAAQVAVQVTGVLRNLAVSPAHTAVFTESGVLTALRVTAAALRMQQEVVLNVGRILSKLSLNEDCQAIMESDPEYAPLLVSLLRQYADHRAILLRIAFVLGNLTTNSNEYRLQVAKVPDSLSTMVSILARYALQPAGAGAGTGAAAAPQRREDQQQQQQGQQQQGQGSHEARGPDRLSRTASPEDCIVKMLRLVANLAIHHEVGPPLSQHQQVVDCLLHLLGTYRYDQAEELVLNCVCALTNLSFYHGGQGNKILEADPGKLLVHITPLLMCDNEEAMVEAARAYGNFSRTHESREYMQTAKVLDAMLVLLDHANYELLYSICGTLINFTVDSDRKEALVELGGVARLMEVMERVVTSAEVTDIEVDILLVLFKALYNICVDDAAADSGDDDGALARPSISENEITSIEAIVEHIRGSEEFAAHDEVLQLSDRLAMQLQLISQRWHQLEPGV